MRWLIVLLALLLSCSHPQPPTPPLPTCPEPTPSPAPSNRPGLLITLLWASSPPLEWELEAKTAVLIWNSHLDPDPFTWDTGGYLVPILFHPGPFWVGSVQAAGAATLGVGPEGGTLQLDASLKGRDRLMVLLHEMGHLMGLPHNPDRGSLMYRQLQPTTSLIPADIEAAQALLNERGRR